MNQPLYKKVGLFFGSFNPIHVGHLIIANGILENTVLDEVWFVVSPQNPHKNEQDLLPENQRLKMVEMAVEENPLFIVSSIEFELSKPSYTIQTLRYLKERYSQNQFSLILGEDNWDTFHTWKNYQEILENYHLFVYPRQNNSKIQRHLYPNVTIVNLPLLNISSTNIRRFIKENKSIQYMVPSKVEQYIKETGCYL